MHEKLHTFLNNNIVYSLQFEFRQQYSTSHALINITENTRKALDDRIIGCGVCVDLQKVFNTVNYQKLLVKIESPWDTQNFN